MIRYIKTLFLLLLGSLICLYSGSAIAGVVPQISGFVTQADGNIVHASDWNTQIGSLYTYINNNLVAAFNVMSAKGDLITNDGTNVVRFTTGGAGNDGKTLIADSTQTNGWRLGTLINVASLSQKGDVLCYDGTLNQALHTGGASFDGYILTARSTAPYGVDWELAGVPSGVISLWSGSVGTIPVGWALCDGQVHSGVTTPNLQGLFIVGAGNASPAATGGMGLLNPGGPSGDTSSGTGLGPAHAHGETAGYGFYGTTQGTGNLVVTSVGNTGSAPVTPRYYALCYIEKL